jgi:hypothetical protein
MTQMMKLMKAVAHAAGCGAYSIRDLCLRSTARIPPPLALAHALASQCGVSPSLCLYPMRWGAQRHHPHGGRHTMPPPSWGGRSGKQRLHVSHQGVAYRWVCSPRSRTAARDGAADCRAELCCSRGWLPLYSGGPPKTLPRAERRAD